MDETGSVPVPDPTKLTTDAVNAATQQWRRELAGFREVFETRLDAMDKATSIVAAELAKVYPSEIEKLVAGTIRLHDKDMYTIDLRFLERDVRTEQAAITSQKALDAALLAAAALVTQQNEANSRASEIVVASTTKQIDSILALIRSSSEATDAKFTDIKERLATDTGSDKTRASAQATMLVIASLIIGVAAIVASIILSRL